MNGAGLPSGVGLEPVSALRAIDPPVSPEARPFWQAAREGRLLLPRCMSCERLIWYPRGVCPACGGCEIDWLEAAGRGVIYSFSVVRRGAPAAFRDVGPYVLAYVELEEGPRVMTNIVTSEIDSLQIGDPVVAVFEPTGEEAALVRFRIAADGSAGFAEQAG
jgi:uncharacterized OB-fold protein